jgi:hypothetical protein
MIKETISYEDIDGNSKTIDAYFHLTIREMARLLKNGIQEKLEAVSSGKASPDDTFDLVDELIKASYGKRIEDNGEAYFMKNPKTTEIFMASEAYDRLLSKLMSDDQFATRFFTGLVPKELIERMNAIGNGVTQNALTPEATQYLAQLNQQNN